MQDHRFSVEMISRRPLPELPSGSALCLQADAVYAVSDNAPCVYRCDTNFQSFEKIPLKGWESYGSTIPKPQKHDLEAAVIASVNGQPTLLAFGSGSLSPQRDQLLILPCSALETQRFIPLTGFYEHLRRTAGIPQEAFNIEAAVVANERLYLMNRGTNTVFHMSLENFLRWIEKQDTLPYVRYQQLNLPRIGKRPAGLSGACPLDDDRILFCASVEDTDNWIDDGAVLGSFVGLLNVREDGRLSVEHVIRLKNADGSYNTDKAEGLLVLPGADAYPYEAVVVADNDALGSVLLRLEIRF